MDTVPPFAMHPLPLELNNNGMLPAKVEDSTKFQMDDLCVPALTSPHVQSLILATLYMSAPSATMLTTQHLVALETDYKHVITPYRVEAWKTALHDLNLQSKYPNLIHDLTFGAPIGNPPRLTYTFIPPNMPSADEHVDMVDEHFSQEFAAGRMSGPYIIQEAHILFHGHFQTAPMGFIEKPPGCRKWRMIRNLSACDSHRFSTNCWLDAKDKPIKWYTCSMLADMVRINSSDILNLLGAVCMTNLSY
jgi:hypothetical protein